MLHHTDQDQVTYKDMITREDTEAFPEIYPLYKSHYIGAYIIKIPYGYRVFAAKGEHAAIFDFAKTFPEGWPKIAQIIQ
jgi:hypothetical protein